MTFFSVVALQLWTELGFQNRVFHDVSSIDIDRHFRELAQYDHSAFDCVVVSILTHGLDGGRIYTSDGEIVSLEKLLKYFDTNKSHPSLIGKPKLFFIQVTDLKLVRSLALWLCVYMGIGVIVRSWLQSHRPCGMTTVLYSFVPWQVEVL